MDQADAVEFSVVASSGVWHGFLHKLHCYRLPRFQSHSILIHGLSDNGLHFKSDFCNMRPSQFC